MTLLSIAGMIAGGLFVLGWIILLIDFLCMTFLEFSLIEKLGPTVTEWYGRAFYVSWGLVLLAGAAHLLIVIFSIEIG